METRSPFPERLGWAVSIALLLMVSFQTIAPFFITIPAENLRLIDQQQTILQSVLLLLAGYLWGTSSGAKAKDQIIERQTDTIEMAQRTLSASTVPDKVELPPGADVNVSATGRKV